MSMNLFLREHSQAVYDSHWDRAEDAITKISLARKQDSEKNALSPSSTVNNSQFVSSPLRERVGTTDPSTYNTLLATADHREKTFLRDALLDLTNGSTFQSSSVRRLDEAPAQVGSQSFQSMEVDRERNGSLIKWTLRSRIK